LAARAIWKGVIRVKSTGVPVKLYSAVKDRGVHFRLLHEKDLAPVNQQMVNPRTEEVVPYAETRRALATDDGELVILEQDEIKALEPPASRDVEVTQFFPAGTIDHRWYDRPYYLGPDGNASAYAALVEALRRTGTEGLAHWVMRKQRYAGALRLRDDHAVLITLHPAEQVVMASAVRGAAARETTRQELAMAKQLVEMLAGDFEPAEYRDAYRERVMELIERKASGKTVRFAKAPPARRPRDLTSALRASLARERKVA
jgi:DNA end-binding protein Ku